MRSFDNWVPLYDESGAPLYGRLSFYKLHTTELLPIYNEDGTVPLQNPMPTSQYGLTDVQVFLQDKDYTVKVEKWMGPSTSMVLDDPNIQDWEEVRTFDNLYPAIMVETPEGLVASYEVATMDFLRRIQVGDGTNVNYVRLLGYYSLGDMPPQLYKLERNSNPSIQDDGGSVIRPEHSTSYIWRLIPQENIDVRVFGVFPSQAVNVIQAYNSQLHNCFLYANKIGKDVYMPQCHVSEGYYYIEGGSHTINQKLVIDSGVFIVAKPLTTSRIIAGEIQYFGSELFLSQGQYGTLYVDCPTVRTSWKCNGWSEWQGNISKIIVDTLNSSFSFTNLIVEFEKEISDKTLTFTNCLITSHQKIKDCTVNLTNCGEVTDRWFSTGCTFLTVSDNILNSSNFEDVNLYIDFKNKQVDPNYGDLGERTVTGKTLLPNSVIENGMFSEVTIVGATEIHNVSGTFKVEGSSASINAIDCWLSLIGSSSVLTSLSMRRGALLGYQSLQVLNTVTLEGIELGLPLTTLGASASIMNSKITGKITATDISLLNNQIYAEIDQRDVEGVITVDCCCNMFHKANGLIAARHYIHATTENSVVRGMWSKNGSSYDNVHWIRLDRTNLKKEDWEHSYSYIGNSEPYLMKWNGRNHPMSFATFKGYREDGTSGEGVFSQFLEPFCFFNTLDRQITVVPRGNYWKMFTVGNLHPMRSGRLMCGRYDGFPIGNAAGPHSNNGQVVPTWYWGCQALPDPPTPEVYEGEVYGSMWCVCRDGDGEADFNYSFEPENEYHYDYDHEHPILDFHYGPYIGCYPSNDFDGITLWSTYPSQPKRIVLFVFIDPDFSIGTNPMGWDPT